MIDSTHHAIENSSPYPAPPDEAFSSGFMDISHDHENDYKGRSSSFELDESMMVFGDMNSEELSSWLNQELDEDEMQFFETREEEMASSNSIEEVKSQAGVGSGYVGNLSGDSRLPEFSAEPYNSNMARTSQDSMMKPGTQPIHNQATPLPYSHPCDAGDNKDNVMTQQYEEALSNLALSMRRTELTRAEILRHRQNMPAVSSLANTSPQASTISSFAGLLTGTRTSLTAGLEQSRRQLQEYMFRMSHQAL